MGLPIAESQEPPPYVSPAPPGDRHKSSSSPPPIAPWQRRWNVEWLDKAMVPGLKYLFLRLQRARNVRNGFTREQIDAMEDRLSGDVAAAIEAGFVSKENALKRTRLPRAIRRCAWPLQLVAHEAKAFKKCWYEFKNRDKVWRVTAVMEEQGENPRWQAEMTFTIQPWQYEQMLEAGQWIEFPSPEDIKWFYVTGPDDRKRLLATDQRHWGPNPNFLAASQPFGERNGRIVRHSKMTKLSGDFHLCIDQTGPRRCNHCGCVG
ncbi:hypothetical protein F4782DRAFT_543685 [Xylaria castorea]|nr:hypothetical protein F4782DRAFT_543685 [Xylaria castorea]